MIEELTDLQRMFLEGFKASGEGFNGEWPFADKNMSDEEIWERIETYFGDVEL